MGKIMSVKDIETILPTLDVEVPHGLSVTILSHLRKEDIYSNAKVNSKISLGMILSRNAKRITVTVLGFIASLIVILPAVEATPKNPMTEILYKWLHRNPVAQRWVSKVDVPVTDHGITVTITDILYSQNQIQVGYTIMPPSVSQKIVSINPNIRLDGKTINETMILDQKQTQYGYDGVISFLPHTHLDPSGKLQLVFSKVGNKNGRWAFNIPVSSIKMDKKMLTVHPMKQYTYKNLNVVITEVNIDPSTTEINYEVSGPKHSMLPIFFEITDNLGNRFESVGGGQVGQPIVSNGTESVEYRATYNTADIQESYLQLTPWIPSGTKKHLPSLEIPIKQAHSQ